MGTPPPMTRVIDEGWARGGLVSSVGWAWSREEVSQVCHEMGVLVLPSRLTIGFAATQSSLSQCVGAAGRRGPCEVSRRKPGSATVPASWDEGWLGGMCVGGVGGAHQGEHHSLGGVETWGRLWLRSCLWMALPNIRKGSIPPRPETLLLHSTAHKMLSHPGIPGASVPSNRGSGTGADSMTRSKIQLVVGVPWFVNPGLVMPSEKP